MRDIKAYPLVSDQIEYSELAVIMRELATCLDNGTPGAIVELGCYSGTTSLFIERLLASRADTREFHAYDSFSGLPEKTVADSSPAGEQFIAGALQVSKQQLIKHFKQAGLRVPIVHKGWFEELTARDVPPRIAFAFLDGDFYTSIKASLDIITPSLYQGSVVVVDDYHTEALPGAKKATDEWAQRHNKTVKVEQSLAIITI